MRPTDEAVAELLSSLPAGIRRFRGQGVLKRTLVDLGHLIGADTPKSIVVTHICEGLFRGDMTRYALVAFEFNPPFQKALKEAFTTGIFDKQNAGCWRVPVGDPGDVERLGELLGEFFSVIVDSDTGTWRRTAAAEAAPSVHYALFDHPVAVDARQIIEALRSSLGRPPTAISLFQDFMGSGILPSFIPRPLVDKGGQVVVHPPTRHRFLLFRASTGASKEWYFSYNVALGLIDHAATLPVARQSLARFGDTIEAYRVPVINSTDASAAAPEATIDARVAPMLARLNALFTDACVIAVPSSWTTAMITAFDNPHVAGIAPYHPSRGPFLEATAAKFGQQVDRPIVLPIVYSDRHVAGMRDFELFDLLVHELAHWVSLSAGSLGQHDLAWRASLALLHQALGTRRGLPEISYPVELDNISVLPAIIEQAGLIGATGPAPAKAYGLAARLMLDMALRDLGADGGEAAARA